MSTQLADDGKRDCPRFEENHRQSNTGAIKCRHAEKKAKSRFQKEEDRF